MKLSSILTAVLLISLVSELGYVEYVNYVSLPGLFNPYTGFNAIPVGGWNNLVDFMEAFMNVIGVWTFLNIILGFVTLWLIARRHVSLE